MKVINEIEWEKFFKYSAIFYTNGGIIVDFLTLSPIINFRKGIEILKLEINEIYLDNEILIVDCKSIMQINRQYGQFIIHNIKEFLSKVDKKIQQQILRSTHWLTWSMKYKYCNKCGFKLHKVDHADEKKCISCNLSFFPNLSPVVIVLIQNDDKILLARSPGFKSGMYGLIAGFIELGEDAEDAVHREVIEEVGIEVSNLEYFGTQSWPFPASFMIAYKAHYLRGTLKLDKNEIEDAAWFTRDNLPQLPSYASIARKLIDSFVLK